MSYDSRRCKRCLSAYSFGVWMYCNDCAQTIAAAMADPADAASLELCSFPGCGNSRLAKGLCAGHYHQSKSGQALTELYLRFRPRGSAPRIRYDEVPCQNPDLDGPCHIFKGMKDEDGYGKVRVGSRRKLVHRYVWERDVGPIPDGMMIDHRCRNPACCNVKHLRVVTPQINSTENVVGSSPQINRAKTHCPHGHEYTDANTHRLKNGWRRCRECDKISSHKYRLAIKKRKGKP